MTSDPRVAEAERAFLEAAERYMRAYQLAMEQWAARSEESRAGVACAVIERGETRRRLDAAYRALRAARAGEEAGRGE